MSLSGKRLPLRQWYLVSTGYASAGLAVDCRTGLVVDAAPIYRWAIGKSWEQVRRWRKIQKVEPAGADYQEI